MPTALLYSPDGQPLAQELKPEEKLQELLCVAFGLLSGVMGQTGELEVLAQRYGSQDAFVKAYTAEIVKVLGAETLKARFPGLQFTAGGPAQAMKDAVEALKDG